MKKYIIAPLVILIISACTNPSQSIKNENSSSILAEMHKVLEGTDPAQIKLIELRKLKFSLARAYIEENRADAAIDLLQDLIKDNRHPVNIYGQDIPMSSPFYGMEELYYQYLAKAYGLKQDKTSQEKAINKSRAAAAIHAKLKPIEEKKETAEKAKRRDAILN